MVSIDAKFDQKQLDKLLKTLEKAPKECRKGAVSAINRSVKSTNTALQKAITRRYNIKKEALSGGSTFKSSSSNNLIRPKMATYSDLTASIFVRGSRLSFNVLRGMVSPTEPKSHKGKSLRQIRRMAPPKVKVLRGRSKSFKHAFIATSTGTDENGQKSKVTGLFSRGSNGVLKFHRTLSPANMAREKSVAKATQKAAAEALEKNVEREIRYRLEKIT